MRERCRRTTARPLRLGVAGERGALAARPGSVCPKRQPRAVSEGKGDLGGGRAIYRRAARTVGYAHKVELNMRD